MLVLMLALFAQSVAGLPNGASVSAGAPDGKGIFFSGITSTTLGGSNVSVNITGETQTIGWQGFFGEVTGNLTLRDSLFNQLFSWETATPQGEIYVSRDSNVDFTSITAQNDCTIDEDLTGTGSDRVNSTFNASSNSEFIVGATTIAANSACSTNSFVNDIGQTSSFEQVILTDDGGTTAIYAALIDADTTGYDGSSHDYQIVVPENSTNATSVYFFYAEIE